MVFLWVSRIITEFWAWNKTRVQAHFKRKVYRITGDGTLWGGCYRCSADKLGLRLRDWIWDKKEKGIADWVLSLVIFCIYLKWTDISLFLPNEVLMLINLGCHFDSIRNQVRDKPLNIPVRHYLYFLNLWVHLKAVCVITSTKWEDPPRK